jgi:thiamine pyrophosphokinase
MDAVILCDGRPPLKSQIERELRPDTLFIAADGGAHIAKKYNLVPHVIIGDLDSYKPSGDEPAEIINDPDQETNDLEKALNNAKEKGVNHVIVFGATGQRLDHTLKNLSVMKQFNSVFKSLIFKDSFSDIFLIESPFNTNLPIGTEVSLFPLSGKVEGITTKGLKFPLINGTLENGVRDGSSNQTVENKLEIYFEKGDLLLFINHKTELF